MYICIGIGQYVYLLKKSKKRDEMKFPPQKEKNDFYRNIYTLMYI